MEFEVNDRILIRDKYLRRTDILENLVLEITETSYKFGNFKHDKPGELNNTFWITKKDFEDDFEIIEVLKYDNSVSIFSTSIFTKSHEVSKNPYNVDLPKDWEYDRTYNDINILREGMKIIPLCLNLKSHNIDKDTSRIIYETNFSAGFTEYVTFINGPHLSHFDLIKYGFRIVE